MHRSLKPHTQVKKITKVPPPALPGDPVPPPGPAPQSPLSAYHHHSQHPHHPHHSHHQQQGIPLYRLGSVGGSQGKVQLEDAIIMSSMVTSPSLEEGGFNLPREPTVALRMKGDYHDEK